MGHAPSMRGAVRLFMKTVDRDQPTTLIRSKTAAIEGDPHLGRLRKRDLPGRTWSGVHSELEAQQRSFKISVREGAATPAPYLEIPA
jgi:hypothetical protein